ncbi:MAG: hypothetical protein ACPL0F_05720 [bacterium]
MKRWVFILGLCLAFGVASPYRFSVGLQADFLSQGISFRLFHNNGLGLHLLGRWLMEKSGSDINYAFRVEKLFRIAKRLRPYLGLGVGGSHNWDTFWGGAAVSGVDVILLQARSGTDRQPAHGLSVNVEIMMGAFKNYFGPGAGIGLHYNW